MNLGDSAQADAEHDRCPFVPHRSRRSDEACEPGAAFTFADVDAKAITGLAVTLAGEHPRPLASEFV